MRQNILLYDNRTLFFVGFGKCIYMVGPVRLILLSLSVDSVSLSDDALVEASAANLALVSFAFMWAYDDVPKW